MDELKKLLIEECKHKIRNNDLSVNELYEISVISDIVQSDRKVVSVNN